MKITEVRELSTAELKEKLYSLKEQLFELRRKKAVGALERGEEAPEAAPEVTGPATASAPDGLTDEMRAKLTASREVARTILEECEGTLVSLEAALALRLDPDCIPATGEEYVRKTGCPRIPHKVISWLIRHQVA